MRHFRTSPRWSAPAAAIGAVAMVLLSGCGTETPKPEASDLVLSLGEEMIADFKTIGIDEVLFLEADDESCESGEYYSQYRMAAFYAIDVEPAAAEATLTAIHELWVDERGFEDLEGGIFWGESGYALTRARNDDVEYGATLDQHQATITVSIVTDCLRNPEPSAWFDPVSPTEPRPSTSPSPA